jgi:hypothetical protein
MFSETEEKIVALILQFRCGFLFFYNLFKEQYTF